MWPVIVTLFAICLFALRVYATYLNKLRRLERQRKLLKQPTVESRTFKVEPTIIEEDAEDGDAEDADVCDAEDGDVCDGKDIPPVYLGSVDDKLRIEKVIENPPETQRTRGETPTIEEDDISQPTMEELSDEQEPTSSLEQPLEEIEAEQPPVEELGVEHPPVEELGVEHPPVEELGVEHPPVEESTDDFRSLVKAQQLKEEGNELYRQSKLEEALSKYMEALDSTPSVEKDMAVVLMCNMAAVHYTQKNYEECVRCCTDCLELEPNHVKSRIRRYKAYNAQSKVHEALADLKAAIDLDATLVGQYGRELTRLEKKSAEQFEKDKEEMIAKAKEFGNWALGKVGMSLDNFKVIQDPATGSYNIQYVPPGAPSEERMQT